VADKEVSSEYKARIKNASSIITKWNEEHNFIQGSELNTDEEIYQEIHATPCMIPRIIIRDASYCGKINMKQKERKIRKNNLLPPLLLMDTLPVKLQAINETLFTTISSRNSGSSNSNKSAHNMYKNIKSNNSSQIHTKRSSLPFIKETNVLRSSIRGVTPCEYKIDRNKKLKIINYNAITKNSSLKEKSVLPPVKWVSRKT